VGGGFGAKADGTFGTLQNLGLAFLVIAVIVPELLQALPPLLKNMLSSGIATGGMSALLLNTVLPGER
jgi:xanthine/uracil permease